MHLRYKVHIVCHFKNQMPNENRASRHKFTSKYAWLWLFTSSTPIHCISIPFIHMLFEAITCFLSIYHRGNKSYILVFLSWWYKKKTDFILWNFLIKKNSKVFSPKIKFLFQVHRHRDKQTNRKRFTAWNSKYKGIYNDTIFSLLPFLPLSVCLPAQSVSRLHLLAYSFVCCFPSKMNGQMIFQLIEDMHVFWTYSSSIFTLGKRISAVFFFLLYASTHILKHCTDSTDFQLNVYLCVRVSIWGQSVYSPRNQREFFRCISKLHFGHIFLSYFSLRQLSPHTDKQNLTWKIVICNFI